MFSVDQFRAACAAENGTTELPSNDVKYNTWFYGHRVNGDGFSWCAVFQSWVWMVGCGGVGGEIHLGTKGSASVFAFRTSFERAGAYGSTPKVGAFVTYDSTSEHDAHIEWVDAVSPTGVWTWGGNTNAAGSSSGGQVHRQFRPFADGVLKIRGYCYPTYLDIHQEEEEDVPYLVAYDAATPKDRPGQFVVIANHIFGVTGKTHDELVAKGIKTYPVGAEVYDKVAAKAE